MSGKKPKKRKTGMPNGRRAKSTTLPYGISATLLLIAILAAGIVTPVLHTLRAKLRPALPLVAPAVK